MQFIIFIYPLADCNLLCKNTIDNTVPLYRGQSQLVIERIRVPANPAIVPPRVEAILGAIGICYVQRKVHLTSVGVRHILHAMITE